MTAAVRAALAEHDGLEGIDNARMELALALARLVDGSGSVPAARELREVLADMGEAVDEEIAAFRASVQVPFFRAGRGELTAGSEGGATPLGIATPPGRPA